MKSSMGGGRGKSDRDRNVLLRFSVFMFLVVAGSAGILGLALTDFVRGHLIRMHGAFYAESLATGLGEKLSIGRPEDFAALREDLERSGRLPHVKELVIWNALGKRLYGNDDQFPPDTVDKPIQKAIEGSVHFNYEIKQEASLLKPFRGDIFLYLPVKNASAKVVAVLGLRESNDALIDDLDESARAIALYVAIAGCVIYGALFLLYYRSYRRQRTSTERLKQSQDSIIFAMSSLSSLRDQETGGHLERCSEYVRLLAIWLRKEKAYKSYIDDEYVRNLASIAPLHDIGKVGIDDAILRKPGKLSPDEFELMKRHSELGAGILRAAKERLSFHSHLELAIGLTRHHHERWDGKGYPDSLKGETIPLSARIMAIADVYDALRSERYYKKAMTHAEAISTIRDGSGSQFDPGIISVFLTSHSEFESVFG
jgi:HD-GYP domain-containing protein (c-di-GMP phosphodiesterase class II)